MKRLAEQQQALLNVLFAFPSEDAIKNIAAYATDISARGLKGYQSNGHFLAEKALGAAYPVLAQLLGAESFAELARALWHAHPPQRGDIAQWGDRLASFLQNNPQLLDEPYLADVACAEWALHQCASAADASSDLGTLALLSTQDPQRLFFRLAPGWAVVSSVWPIVSIMGAHREQNPSLELAGQQLRAALAQDALVWRAGLRPCIRTTNPGETVFLQTLGRGGAILQALEAAEVLDFGLWLPDAVQSGLVLEVTHYPHYEA